MVNLLRASVRPAICDWTATVRWDVVFSLVRAAVFGVVTPCVFSADCSVWLFRVASLSVFFPYACALRLFPPSLPLFFILIPYLVPTPQTLSVVHVDRRSDEGLDEIEDCWQLRDAGYNTIWVSEVKYCVFGVVS